MDYSNSNKDRDATEDYYSSEDEEATKKNEDYYSSEDDGKATKKNEDYYSSEDDGEATKKNEDYYSSEDDGEATKKNEDHYSDGGEDEGGAKSSDPDEDKERADLEKETYDEVFEYLTKGTYPQHATKRDKGVLRRKAKSFQVVEGILHYKGKKGELRQV